MAISLKDLLDSGGSLKLLLGQRSGPICSLCNERICDEHPDEIRKVDDKPVHEDCYYGALSELVEEYPITSAGLRRS